MNEHLSFRSAPRWSDRLLVILLVVLIALFIRSIAVRLIGPTTPVNSNPIVSVTPAVPSETIVPAVPVRFRIPAIGVDANVQPVGITEAGLMDVPKGDDRYIDVGWYSLGAKPGEIGTAVIDGHLDTYNLLSPGVFHDLEDLVVGDIVEVIDEKGMLFRFRVTGSEEVSAGGDATFVFNSTNDSSHLNLITCSGDWKQDQRQYDRRLVVFTELIQ